MSETNTFSSLIDSAIIRSGRPNIVNDIISYARSSIFECESELLNPETLIEDQLTSDADPYIWPRPVGLRRLIAVKFPALIDGRGNQIFSKHRQPGMLQKNQQYYHYQSGNSIIFTGMGANATIDIAYFAWLPKLAYYSDPTQRPATYDDQTLTWTYLTATTDAEKEIAEAQVSNWLLFNFFETILEGTMAKIHKQFDDPRSRSSFALYKSYQKQMKKSVLGDSYSGDDNAT